MLMKSQQLFAYLGVNWNENSICIKPDTKDDNFAAETSVQFTTKLRTEKSQTSETMHSN